MVAVPQYTRKSLFSRIFRIWSVPSTSCRFLVIRCIFWSTERPEEAEVEVDDELVVGLSDAIVSVCEVLPLPLSVSSLSAVWLTQTSLCTVAHATAKSTLFQGVPPNPYLAHPSPTSLSTVCLTPCSFSSCC